jgi:hypothetical protein
MTCSSRCVLVKSGPSRELPEARAARAGRVIPDAAPTIVTDGVFEVVALVLSGLVVGVWLGIRWAERRRALYDIARYARQTWRNRSEYRRKSGLHRHR